MGLHSQQTPALGIHGAIAYPYANEAARLAATGFVAEDVYKFSVEMDTWKQFMLVNHSPITWVDVGNAAVGQLLNKVEIPAIKATAGTIPVGKVVRQAGWDVGNSRAEVELAQSTPTGTQFAVGVCSEEITDSSPGKFMLSGTIEGIDTSGKVAAPVYLSTTAGEFTNTAPAGPNLVQPVGVISNVDASDGVLGVNILSFRPIDYASDPEALGVAAAGTNNVASPSDHVHLLPKLDDLNAPDDNTDLNVSAVVHGLFPKLPNTAADRFWREDGTWQDASADVDGVQIYHVGKNGNDSNDGLHPNKAFLTFGAAITAAQSQTPSASNRFAIRCSDAGVYTENLTLVSWVDVEAETAVLVGTVALVDDSRVDFRRIKVATGLTGVTKSSGTGNSAVRVGQLVCAGTADGILNSGTDSELFVEASVITVVDGDAISNLSGGSGHIHAKSADIYISGDGRGLVVNGGKIYGQFGEIEDKGTGTTKGIEVQSGSCRAVVRNLEADTAYQVDSGASLYAFINKIDGTTTVDPAATARVTVAGTGQSYGQILVVAKSNGDYTTIQAAIDSITDASASKKYLVYVQPGVYEENVTMADYVDVLGVSGGTTTISVTSGTAVTIAGTFPASSSLSGLNITASYGTLTQNEALVKCSSGLAAIAECRLSASSTGGNFTCKVVEHTGGILAIRLSQVNYSRSGGTGTLSQRAVECDFAGFAMVYCRLDISQSSGNDDLYATWFGANAAGASVEYNQYIVSNDSSDAHVGYIAVDGLEFRNNTYDIEASADAYGYTVVGTSNTFKSVQDTYEIIGTANSYLANVASTCSLQSILNHASSSVVAGVGSYTFVEADDSGNLRLSGSVTDGSDSVTVAQMRDALKLQGRDIDAAAPSDGQVLTWSGGDGEWEPATPAASGESNTAANVGTAGVGFYKEKSGVELRFKKLNAGSSKVTVTDDTGNDEVDVDVAEANIVHQNLSGAGTNTHAQVDSHIASTANPHTVTAAQVGNATAQWNADKLQGRNVSAAAPTDEHVLTWNDTASQWEGAAAPGSSAVFGSDYDSAASKGESTTTSSSPQLKVQMVTPSGLNGTYRLAWHARIANSNVNASVYVNLLDSSTGDYIGGIYQAEHKDSNNRIHVGGFEEIVMSGTARIIQLFYYTDGGTASIDEAVIEFWRIS